MMVVERVVVAEHEATPPDAAFWCCDGARQWE
jgi:hypothetical protein